MPNYRQAPQEDVDLLARVLEDYHAELKDAGVRIGLLHAHARRDEETGEPLGPALKHHGYPAAAIVRIKSQRDRVAGSPDAVVEVDGDRWPDWTPQEKAALLDHELQHLSLARGKEGEILVDDCFRPKLKMRPHDFQLGIFEAVIDRHGINSLDAQGYRDLHRVMFQKTFPWG